VNIEKSNILLTVISKRALERDNISLLPPKALQREYEI